MDVPSNDPHLYFWLNVAAVALGGLILAAGTAMSAGIWWSYRKFIQFEGVLESIRDMLASAIKRIDAHEQRWERIDSRISLVETKVAVLEDRRDSHPRPEH